MLGLVVLGWAREQARAQATPFWGRNFASVVSRARAVRPSAAREWVSALVGRLALAQALESAVVEAQAEAKVGGLVVERVGLLARVQCQCGG